MGLGNLRHRVAGVDQRLAFPCLKQRPDVAAQRLGNLLFLRWRPAAHGRAGDGGSLEHQSLNINLMSDSPAHKADDDQSSILFSSPRLRLK